MAGDGCWTQWLAGRVLAWQPRRGGGRLLHLGGRGRRLLLVLRPATEVMVHKGWGHLRLYGPSSPERRASPGPGRGLYALPPVSPCDGWHVLAFRIAARQRPTAARTGWSPTTGSRWAGGQQQHAPGGCRIGAGMPWGSNPSGSAWVPQVHAPHTTITLGVPCTRASGPPQPAHLNHTRADARTHARAPSPPPTHAPAAGPAPSSSWACPAPGAVAHPAAGTPGGSRSTCRSLRTKERGEEEGGALTAWHSGGAPLLPGTGDSNGCGRYL